MKYFYVKNLFSVCLGCFLLFIFSLVAVPGRLVHLLVEVKDLSLKNVEYLVFDEADRYESTNYTL